MLENVLKWRTDSDTNLNVVCRHHWSRDAFRQQSGWCRYLSSTLTHFLTFNLSRFSFYINIFRQCVISLKKNCTKGKKKVGLCIWLMQVQDIKGIESKNHDSKRVVALMKIKQLHTL